MPEKHPFPVRILLLCPLRYVASMAFVVESILAFAERGHFVDALVSDACDPPLKCDHKNVRLYYYRAATTRRGMQYLSLFKSAHLLVKVEHYDMAIGLSQIGLVIAALIKARFGIPYIFYNDEIWYGNERHTLHGNIFGYTMKLFERFANKHALFTVTQDPKRGYFLSSVNNIPMASLRYLPNSRSGKAKLLKSYHLHKMFDFPTNSRIILWMGGVSPNDGALELAHEAQTWAQDYRMVFHFFTENPTPYMREIMKHHGKGHVYVSNKPIPYAEVDNLAASATIGLGMYADKGINARYICKSSGKINSFLKRGVPCIVKNYEGLRWVEDSGAGLCVSHALDVYGAAKEIIKNYEKFQRRSIDAFESLLSFDEAFVPIAEEIEMLFGSK